MIVPARSISPFGAVVPTPIFPPDCMRIFSVPLVLKARSTASVVPKKSVPAVVEAFPLRVQAWLFPEAADEIFDILMGSEVAPRKKFIQTHAKEVKNLDT